MKWPWSRIEPYHPKPGEGDESARAAVERAKTANTEAEKRLRETKEVARKLNMERWPDTLAPAILNAMKPKGQK